MTTDKGPVVSHGRGGQGNIRADSTEYVDASVVRQGEVGDQGDGAYSAGRGGAGNIGSPHIRPTCPSKAHDVDVIPDIAAREPPTTSDGHGDFHVGRGGQGNIHLDESHQHRKHQQKEKDGPQQSRSRTGSPIPEGLADKLKNKILGKK